MKTQLAKCTDRPQVPEAEYKRYLSIYSAVADLIPPANIDLRPGARRKGAAGAYIREFNSYLRFCKSADSWGPHNYEAVMGKVRHVHGAPGRFSDSIILDYNKETPDRPKIRTSLRAIVDLGTNNDQNEIHYSLELLKIVQPKDIANQAFGKFGMTERETFADNYIALCQRTKEWRPISRNGAHSLSSGGFCGLDGFQYYSVPGNPFFIPTNVACSRLIATAAANCSNGPFAVNEVFENGTIPREAKEFIEIKDKNFYIKVDDIPLIPSTRFLIRMKALQDYYHNHTGELCKS